MGTSATSSGPPSGVSLVPPWVDDPEHYKPVEDEEASEDEGGRARDGPTRKPVQLARPYRFRTARTHLGRFGSSGDSGSLRSGLGHYARTGLGGSGWATRRLAGTARKAGRLYSSLDALSRGTEPPAYLDSEGLAGRPAREAVDFIADALSPSDGAQDSEVSRDSMSRAMCELLRRDPDVDLTALSAQQIELVTELFVAEDVCRRVELDVGKAVFEAAGDAAMAIRRLDEMYRYVSQVVGLAFRDRLSEAGRPTQEDVVRIAEAAIRQTFSVFESYLS